MASEIHGGRGYVYCLRYLVVWCVKHRHKVLTEEIVTELENILRKIANDNKFPATFYPRHDESNQRGFSKNSDEKVWRRAKTEAMGRASLEPVILYFYSFR